MDLYSFSDYSFHHDKGKVVWTLAKPLPINTEQ